MSLFNRRWYPEAGIWMFCGENGSGKTMVAVERLIVPALRSGFPVASNVTVKTELLGLDRDESYIPIGDWTDIPKLGSFEGSLSGGRPCVVFFDEFSSVLPARFYQQTPAELLIFVDQFRKHDCLVAGTVPNFSKVEKSVRGVTQRVTQCFGSQPCPWQLDTDLKPVKDERGKRVPHPGLWPQNMRFDTEDYYPEIFEASVQRGMPADPIQKQRWLLKKMWAPVLVDTKERVRPMNFIVDGSLCPDCGLKLRTEYCKGHTAATVRTRKVA